MENNYIVLVKVNGKGCVVAINSDAFVADPTNWTKIDEGAGDKYHHAQSHYLPAPVMDERGVYRYKLEGSQIVERSAAEMDADAKEATQQPTTEERLEALEAALLEMIMEG